MTFDLPRFLADFHPAVSSLMQETVGLEMNLSATGEEVRPVLDSGVLVLVAIVGQLEGQVVLSMGAEFALRYTEALLGCEVTEIDEVTESAICELANMVGGQATMVLHAREVDCDLAPPTLLVSEKARLAGVSEAVHLGRFDSGWGPLDVRVQLRPTQPRTRSAPPARTDG